MNVKKTCLLFITVFIVSFFYYGFTTKSECANTHNNYWLIPVFDNSAHNITYVVQESNEELEYRYISSITGGWGYVSSDNQRASLYQLDIQHKNGDDVKATLKMKDNGQVDIQVGFEDRLLHPSNFRNLKTVSESDRLN